MTHEQFIVWLHGFFEISNAKTLDEKQVQIIKDHLNLFFDKHTPDREEPDLSEETQKEIWEKILERINRDEDAPQINNITPCLCGDFNTIWCPVHGPKIAQPDWTYRPEQGPFYHDTKIIC